MIAAHRPAKGPLAVPCNERFVKRTAEMAACYERRSRATGERAAGSGWHPQANPHRSIQFGALPDVAWKLRYPGVTGCCRSWANISRISDSVHLGSALAL